MRLIENPTRPQNELEYSDDDLVNTLREVHNRHKYENMSVDTYKQNKDPEHPSHATIANRLGDGSWVEAKEEYL